MSDVKDPSTAVVVNADSAPKAVPRVGRGGTSVQGRQGFGPVAEDRVQSFEGARPSWPATAQYAQALIETRRHRSRRLLGWFTLVVLLPTFLTGGYFLLIATPRYSSKFEFTYQTYRGPSSLASGLVQSVTGTSQTNTVDLGSIVYEYMRSPALAEKLDASLDLRKHFTSPKIDWLSRLAGNASRESFLNYFRSHVIVSQGLGGYLDVMVQAYDPGFAQFLARAVVTASDDMVDDLTARARQNEVKFAEAELGRQEDRVRKARLALATFQNQHGDQDPTRAASQLGTIVGTIESDLSAARTQLSNTAPSLAANSPIVTQLKVKITSLEQQLKEEQQRLASTTSGTNKPYSDVLAEYSSLQLEQEFAKNAYMAAQQGLTVARADAATKQNYLVDFVPPTLPERMSYLYPLQMTATVFLSMLLVLTFGSLVMGAARDQIVG